MLFGRSKEGATHPAVGADPCVCPNNNEHPKRFTRPQDFIRCAVALSAKTLPAAPLLTSAHAPKCYALFSQATLCLHLDFVSICQRSLLHSRGCRNECRQPVLAGVGNSVRPRLGRSVVSSDTRYWYRRVRLWYLLTVATRGRRVSVGSAGRPASVCLAASDGSSPPSPLT